MALGDDVGAIDAAGFIEGDGFPCSGVVPRPPCGMGVGVGVCGDNAGIPVSALLEVPGRRIGAAERRVAPVARPSLSVEVLASPRNSCICCCNSIVAAEICSQVGSLYLFVLDADQEITGRGLPKAGLP